MPDQEVDQSAEQARPEERKTASTAPLVLVVPALLLLRFLGDHTWAYWVAAVIGGVGAVLAVMEITTAARCLWARHRMPASVWAGSVLIAGVVMLGVRLIGN